MSPEPRTEEFFALLAFKSGGILPMVGLASVSLAGLECIAFDVPLSEAGAAASGRASRRLIVPLAEVRTITPLTFEETRHAAEALDWSPLPAKMSPADAPDGEFPF